MNNYLTENFTAYFAPDTDVYSPQNCYKSHDQLLHSSNNYLAMSSSDAITITETYNDTLIRKIHQNYICTYKIPAFIS